MMGHTEKQPYESTNGNGGTDGSSDRPTTPHLDVDLLNAYLDGTLRTREEALAFARELTPRRPARPAPRKTQRTR